MTSFTGPVGGSTAHGTQTIQGPPQGTPIPQHSPLSGAKVSHGTPLPVSNPSPQGGTALHSRQIQTGGGSPGPTGAHATSTGSPGLGSTGIGSTGGPPPTPRRDDIIPLPSHSRGELAKMMEQGVKEIVHEGRTFSVDHLYKLSQATQQQGEAAQAGPRATTVTLRGDDRMVVVKNPVNGGFASLDLRSAEVFGQSIAKSFPEESRAILRGVAMMRRDADGVQSFKREPPMRGGYTAKTFIEEAVGNGLLNGKDVMNKDLCPREELERGMSIYSQAESARGNMLIFGRSDEVNHTNAGFFGYTSERNNGAILMPEKWNLFMNDCWLMGGVKGGAEFAPLTVFKDGAKSDFRSDETDNRPGELPNHFVITVSVAEMKGLEAFGYKAEPHPRFGTILRPGTDEASVARREGATLTQLHQIMQLMTVTQAIENITGDNRMAPQQRAFIGQDRPESTALLGEVVDMIKSGGIAYGADGNALVRKGETKIDAAYNRIETLAETGGSGKAQMLEEAWQEVTNGALLIADDRLRKSGASEGESAAVRAELTRFIERQRDAGKTGFGRDMETVRAFVDTRIGAKDGQRAHTLELFSSLDKLEARFKDSISTQKRPKSEVQAMWEGFRSHAARLGDITPLALAHEAVHFVGAHRFLGTARAPALAPPVETTTPRTLPDGRLPSKL